MVYYRGEIWRGGVDFQISSPLVQRVTPAGRKTSKSPQSIQNTSAAASCNDKCTLL